MQAEPETFVVGDVQGCALELEDLLDRSGFDPGRHRLASVGDLINRGPSSKAVLELAERLEALVVVGNHEDGLLKGKGGTLELVRQELGPDLPKWLEWMRRLPEFLRFDGWILVHAGIAPGKRPEECTRQELTRIREVDGRPWFDAWQGPETVVFGHWATLGKVDLPLAKGLDTGCVYGGSLTGLWWPSQRWVSVPARRKWFDWEAHRPLW
jgi:bis(5'-nucleosyl)-tetraphosphatase (symmetrical)